MAKCQLFSLLFLWLCVLYITEAQPFLKAKKAKPVPKRRPGDIMQDLEKNVTALWKQVETLDHPVHVHVHGDAHLKGHHDCHDHHYQGHPHQGHTDEDHGMHRHNHSDHHPHHEDDKDDSHHHGHKDHRHDDHKHKSKKMKHRDKDDDDHDDDDDDDDMHRGRGSGTHVHIHLHTEPEEEEMRPHHFPSPPPKEYLYARCDVHGHIGPLTDIHLAKIQGTIFFRQWPQKPLEVKMDLQGFKINHTAEGDHQHLRGIHGHVYGDMSGGCNSMGGHYNPENVVHGGLEDDIRHPGDFGNLQLEENGTVVTSFNDTRGSLFGPSSLLGRGIVIHAGADDLGKGGDEGSRSSGNAGARIACCAIVICAEPAGVWSI